MSSKIINSELFLEARRTKYRKMRFVFYLLASLIIFVPPFLPIPYAPEFFHDILANNNGALVSAFVVLLFVICFSALFLTVLFELIVHRRLNKLALLEVFVVPTILLTLFPLFSKIVDETPKQLVSMNIGKSPEEFSNPFLNYKMLDCRNVSENYDVVFIPAHFSIETEFLAYAPRIKDKKLDYKRGKKYGEDWYLDFTGSMWGEDLRQCVQQNKSPYDQNR